MAYLFDEDAEEMFADGRNHLLGKQLKTTEAFYFLDSVAFDFEFLIQKTIVSVDSDVHPFSVNLLLS
jgi:hypothetical protein